MSKKAKRAQAIEKRAQANADEFMEKGPGLRTSTRHWILSAVVCDEGTEWMLMGGCGSFGMGTIWVSHRGPDPTGYLASLHADPTYAEAPRDPTMRDDFGEQVCLTCGETTRLRNGSWSVHSDARGCRCEDPAIYEWHEAVRGMPRDDEWPPIPPPPGPVLPSDHLRSFS